ncbi:MAG TPA: beta-propeller fold lactonase family protein [Actinospica sp.]|nr:beta-propeller fold lactonase family protein [Actinospica sp.]
MPRRLFRAAAALAVALAATQGAAAASASAPATAPAAASAAVLYAYVPNAISRDVTVINLDTRSVAATITTGGEPLGAVVSPSGRYAYVIADAVFVIDASTLTIKRKFTENVGSAEGIAITPDGKGLYIAGGVHTLKELNAYSGAVIATATTGTYPEPLAVSSDGSRVYVGNYGDGTIQVFTADLSGQPATISGMSGPTRLVLTPDGKTLYVANSLSHYVTAIDTATDAVIATIPTYGRPSGLSISPDGTTVYVATRSGHASSVQAISVARNHVVDTYPVGADTDAVALTPSGDIGVAVVAGAGQAVVFTTRGKKVRATLPTGAGPEAVAIGRYRLG